MHVTGVLDDAPATPHEPPVPLDQVPPGPLGLPELVGDEKVFLHRYWALSPLLRRGTSPHLSHLLTMARMAEILTSGWLRLPHLRVLLEGLPVPDGSFAGPRRIGRRLVTDAVAPDKVLREFRRGSTLVLDAVELLEPAVRALCDRLAGPLCCPLGASAVLAPPALPGRRLAPPRSAGEDVFLLQLSGAQRMTVYERFRAAGHPAAVTASHGAVALAPELRPGDLLYLPQGTPYRSVPASGDHSLHLTLAAAPRVPGAPVAPPAAAQEWDEFLPLAQFLVRIQQRTHHALSRRAADGPPRLDLAFPASAVARDGDRLREALARLDTAGAGPREAFDTGR